MKLFSAKPCGGCNAAVLCGKEGEPAYRGTRCCILLTQGGEQCQSLHHLLLCCERTPRGQGECANVSDRYEWLYGGNNRLQLSNELSDVLSNYTSYFNVNLTLGMDEDYLLITDHKF